MSSSTSSSSGGRLVAGRVGRAHGLDGSFRVAEARAELLGLGARVTVAGVEREIVRRAGTDDSPIVRLEGVDGRDALEPLRGEALLVPRSAAPPLEDDEYWADDLVGCVVRDGAREVGVVDRLLAYPSCDLLEVPRPDAEPLLVPLVRDAIRSVDVEERVIEIDLAFLGEA